MTEATAHFELERFLEEKAPQEKSNSGVNKPISIALGSILLLLIACAWISYVIIQDKKTEILNSLETRQQIALNGKADVFRTWIEQSAQQANTLVGNPLIKLFASEIHALKGQELSPALSAQLPFMQNAINQFVRENNLIAAYMIGSDGRAYLASSNSPSLSREQRELAQKQYSASEYSTSPLHLIDGEVAIDFVIPVLAAQPLTENTNEPIGAFLMTLSAANPLAGILSRTPVSMSGERTLIFQKGEAGYNEVTPNRPPFLKTEETFSLNEDLTSFTERELDRMQGYSYTVSRTIENTHILLLQAVPSDVALQPLKTYSYVVLGLAVSVFVVVCSIGSGIWFSLRTQNAKNLADQYKDLAQRINAQRRLLGNINSTVQDLISLKGPDGTYVYANPALARFVDFPETSIPGKTDRDLFGDKIARKFSEMDNQVAETGETVNEILELELQKKSKIVRVEKSQLVDDDGTFLGIVTVSGDITDFITFQRLKDELGQKTISILVRMLEANDPHLAGHSNHMSVLTSNVADILSLTREQKENLHAGANLSQIGKISIPAEIRTKEGRLSESEKQIMQGHVTKAEALLREMEIDEAVITAICQMYERQDGSGYPLNLEGQQIDLLARILGMADILVARVSPRSYRSAISVEEAMEVFRTNPDKYDEKIVEAFDQFLGTKAGEAFEESLKQAAADMQ
ncbi:HD domain-containing phosphohydrolase [Sneathiella limimaris]|uniref:HD domain-containing phosphohydrolase n=1 Tax=Sneathiella limimaris TaxID=1964213 RepID=UPI00146BB5A7|nr:HD domain-containing phosphohydrolase [Sneathiella limimaris]